MTELMLHNVAIKAADENSWEAIEFLFRPSNYLELFLRLDMQGIIAKLSNYDDISNRDFATVYPMIQNAINRERLYRRIKAYHLSRKEPT